MHQPEVVLSTFLEADEEFSEAVVPGSCARHHPAPCWVAPVSRAAFSAMPEVRDIATVLDTRLNLGKVVPFVKAQVPGMVGWGARPPHGKAV
jgi:hypothetical protein